MTIAQIDYNRARENELRLVIPQTLFFDLIFFSKVINIRVYGSQIHNIVFRFVVFLKVIIIWHASRKS